MLGKRQRVAFCYEEWVEKDWVHWWGVFFPSYVLSFSHLSWSLASTNQGSNLMDTAVIVLRRMIPFSNCSPPSPYIPVISNWIMMLLCMRRDYSFWRIFTGEIFNCLLWLVMSLSWISSRCSFCMTCTRSVRVLMLDWPLRALLK